MKTEPQKEHEWLQALRESGHCQASEALQR